MSDLLISARRSSKYKIVIEQSNLINKLWSRKQTDNYMAKTSKRRKAKQEGIKFNIKIRSTQIMDSKWSGKVSRSYITCCVSCVILNSVINIIPCDVAFVGIELPIIASAYVKNTFHNIKLIIDTRMNFCIYAKRACRLLQWRSNP